MQNQNTNQPSNNKPEGTISVDYVPPKAKNDNRNTKQEEFIDYEEVK